MTCIAPFVLPEMLNELIDDAAVRQRVDEGVLDIDFEIWRACEWKRMGGRVTNLGSSKIETLKLYMCIICIYVYMDLL